MRMKVIFVLLLAAAAGLVWSGDGVTVVGDLDDLVFVGGHLSLEDGVRSLDPVRAPWPAWKTGDIRFIATVEPNAEGPVLRSINLFAAGFHGVPFRTKDEEEVEVEGLVTAVNEDDFEMSCDAGDFTVVVDEETEFKDFDGLEDLTVGDRVRVRGERDGDVITAENLSLLEESDGGGGDDDGDDEQVPTGVDFVIIGRISGLTNGADIRLDGGQEFTTDSATHYSGGLVGYGDLKLGMMVEIDGSRGDAGVNLAVEIALKSEEDGVVELSGIVQFVDLTGFSLLEGPRIEVVSTTVFDGDADQLSDIGPGWSVEVEVYDDGGALTALEVDADDPAVASITGEDFEPQQALVIVIPGVQATTVATRYGATVVGEIGDVASLFWWEDDIDDQLLATMDSDPQVDAVEPNYLFRDPESVRRRYVVVDRQVDNSDFNEQVAAMLAGLASAQKFADGSGSVVAVMDTGVDPTHPAIADSILDGGLDLVDGDLEPWETRDGIDQDGDGDIDESAGHGTFVASLTVLTAPGAGILPYRVLDDDGGGSAYLLSLALADAIDRQVDVISLSLVYHRRSAAVDRLLERAGRQGITVVAAAGNDGGTVLPFPASDRHTVAVTGMSANGTALAPDANRSGEAWLAAPSEDIYGAVDGGEFGVWSGTSMAAPFVAGSFALLRQADPGLDPVVFRELLLQSGRPIVDDLWNGVGLDLDAALETLAPTFGRTRLTIGGDTGSDPRLEPDGVRRPPSTTW